MKNSLRIILCIAVLFLFSTAPFTACSTEPTAAAENLSTPVQGKPDIKVWVNTASGVYHCPGTRWYGITKRGEYMTQKEALAKKYRPAYGKYCE